MQKSQYTPTAPMQGQDIQHDLENNDNGQMFNSQEHMLQKLEQEEKQLTESRKKWSRNAVLALVAIVVLPLTLVLVF